MDTPSIFSVSVAEAALVSVVIVAHLPRLQEAVKRILGLGRHVGRGVCVGFLGKVVDSGLPYLNLNYVLDRRLFPECLVLGPCS